MPFPRILACVAFLACCAPATACDLCAIYGANDARGELSQGPLLTVAEMFIPFDTLQFDGQEVRSANPDFLDRSITHLVPGYNFSKRLGLSLNVPLVYHEFQRSDVHYALSGADVFFTERGSESGLGDIALIGRGAVLHVSHMKYGIVVNVLGGVKFPTGDSERLKDEVEQTLIFGFFSPAAITSARWRARICRSESRTTDSRP
jgi:hypothetical protein